MLTPRSTLVVALVVLATGCSCVPDDEPRPDGGGPGDAGVGDAGVVDAPPGDAPVSPCTQVTIDRWALDVLDDVSIRYVARLTPAIGGEPYDLYLEFLRYGDVEYVGTFDLGTGPDANHSTCAHCVKAFTGTGMSEGFFVDRGTLELRSEPWEQTLDAALRGVRLIEVTIEGETLVSVPVPGGRCLEIADAEVDQSFPPSGWRCAAEQWGDGATCHCTCGAIDRDCDGMLPVVGCGEDEVCGVRLVSGEDFRFENTCLATCDRAADRRCTVGVCAFGSEGEICYTEAGVLDDAALGETCAEGATLCAPVPGGYADGFCDVSDRGDGTCRRACDADSDCDVAAFERCFTIFGGAEVGTGFCSPRYPAAWTCSGALYAEGTACDCGCGAPDLDCEDRTAPIRGCGTGEVCSDAECVPRPGNDTCTGALALVVGTAAAPGVTTGTTRGASNDLATVRDTGACIDVDELGPDVAYRLDLLAGDALTVVGTPTDFDLALYLIGPGGPGVCDASASSCVAGSDAAGYGTADTLTFTATTTGPYYLIVDSFFEGYSGAFRLESHVSR